MDILTTLIALHLLFVPLYPIAAVAFFLVAKYRKKRWEQNIYKDVPMFLRPQAD